MSEKEFIENLKNRGIELSIKQIEQFRSYAKFLLEYNEHTNLTAIRDLKDVYLKHFYDSLILLFNLDIEDKSILDVGSGAGFPGIPLKIVKPSIKLTLLDSNRKKTIFLNLLKEKIELDYDVVHARCEEYIKEKREHYDIVTARAVKEMSILAELTIPFVKLDGYFIAYKGNIDDTIENGLYAIDVLGGKVENILRETLPFENSKRNIILISKKKNTQKQYPRLMTKILKKPLQKI